MMRHPRGSRTPSNERQFVGALLEVRVGLLCVALVSWSLLAPSVFGDVIELKNGRRLNGKVLKQSTETVTFEASMEDGGAVVTIPADRILKITIEKSPPAPTKTPTPKPTPTPERIAETKSPGVHSATTLERPKSPAVLSRPKPGSAPPASPGQTGGRAAGNTRTRAEVMALIDKAGRTRPQWWDSVQLNYPKTLDLSWNRTKQWNNQRNLGQFIWDIINPNPHRWREGIKLLHHCLTVNRGNPEALDQTIEALAGMYKRLMGDHARAAFWWHKSIEMRGRYDPIGLAECYWKLGNQDMAVEILGHYPRDTTGHSGIIKLWSDMGGVDRALRMAEAKARYGMPQEGYLVAGDVCRLAGRYDDALAYYEKVARLPGRTQQNKDYFKRNRDRALASIEAIKVFDTLDLRRIPDGKYQSNSVGYRGQIYVEVTVKSGRIEDVRVTKHQEKQYYSSIQDTTAQIIEKQGVKGVDATSRATITAEAIINATAKALAGGMK